MLASPSVVCLFGQYNDADGMSTVVCYSSLVDSGMCYPSARGLLMTIFIHPLALLLSPLTCSIKTVVSVCVCVNCEVRRDMTVHGEVASILCLPLPSVTETA